MMHKEILMESKMIYYKITTVRALLHHKYKLHSSKQM